MIVVPTYIVYIIVYTLFIVVAMWYKSVLNCDKIMILFFSLIRTIIFMSDKQ